MKNIIQSLFIVFGAIALTSMPSRASSHMDAPLVTLDPAANTTDVYAFVSQINSAKYLTVALAVYPFEEPGIGPNKYNFDSGVTYAINLATGADVQSGTTTVSYTFTFSTAYKNTNTIAQSYLGPIDNVNDGNQNLTQTYTLQKTVGKAKPTVLLQNALVPPNNQGLVTRFYNQGDDGENPAREGVATAGLLDRYTSQTVYTTPQGYYVFAGQRDDGFYADIQSIFDLDFTFGGPNKPFDSQGGFNVHTIVLSIPLTDIPGGGSQIAGVWASTSRAHTTVLRKGKKPKDSGKPIQVGRQGNPLFCEALVAIVDKDLYNATDPTTDDATFKKYALNPELATILGLPQNLRTNRTDLAGIFVPDLIKVDLSTAPARLAGGTNPGAAPDDAGFSRLSIFGGDTLTSTVQPGFGGGAIPGGWPNGRRFGDDVLDIAVLALSSDLRTSPPMIAPGASTADVDRVNHNDIGYNKVFPYAATPLNGRDHGHH